MASLCLLLDPVCACDPIRQGLALDNAIEGLLGVSYSDDAATQCQAVCALRLMSAHFPNMRRIIEMNSLDSLKATAQSTGLETQKETAGLLSNLTRIDENKILVAQHSILPHIFTLAKSAGNTLSCTVCCLLLVNGCIPTQESHHPLVLLPLCSWVRSCIFVCLCVYASAFVVGLHRRGVRPTRHGCYRQCCGGHVHARVDREGGGGALPCAAHAQSPPAGVP